ncbi:MAG: hypothetical protein GX182_04370, partial [Firmicutes bacterium]|nr:hypothetical protein [Bacillota bacterium]
MYLVLEAVDDSQAEFKAGEIKFVNCVILEPKVILVLIKFNLVELKAAVCRPAYDGELIGYGVGEGHAGFEAQAFVGELGLALETFQ